MKKSVLLFVAVVAFSAASYAQGVNFGIKAGVNIANQKMSFGSLSETGDALIGFHVGGFASIMFTEKFGLQPQLLYNAVGSKMEDTEFKSSYLSVPVMFRYQPIEILNIHAGPQFGFLLSSKVGDEDFKDFSKSLDLGLGFGAGIDLPMGIGFSARYVLGLSNTWDVEEVDEFFGEDLTVKNNVFQISVSYRFGGN